MRISLPVRQTVTRPERSSIRSASTISAKPKLLFSLPLARTRHLAVTCAHPSSFHIFLLQANLLLLQPLMHKFRLPTLLKLHRRRQTSNLILILRHRISHHTILPRRDLFRQINLLRQCRLALLDRTLEVDVLDGVAEIGGLFDDGDQAVFDLQVDFGALRDVLGEGAFGCYC